MHMVTQFDKMTVKLHVRTWKAHHPENHRI